MIVRVKKAVRRLARREEEFVEPSGAETEAQWHQMLAGIERANREADRRLEAAERALNRLTLQ